MAQKKQNGEKSIAEELKRAKEDLEDLETYIEEFSYFLPLAICATNPSGFVIDVNQSFQKLSGYGSSEIIGKPIDIIFSEKKELDLFLDQSQKEMASKVKELILVSKNKKEVAKI